MKKTSFRDVAKLAKVSTATVSRIVRGQANVDPVMRDRVRAAAEQLGVPATSCRVEAGNVKSEIVRIARELHADLIVLGSRERHGLSILVNFTEDTVLHAAPCDVLAVRVGRS